MARLPLKPSRKPRYTLDAGATLLLLIGCVATIFVVLVSRRLSDHADWHLGVSRPAAAVQPPQPAAATEAAPFNYALEHEEPACAAQLQQTSRIMFMIIGGRGYHDVRTRQMLHSWARCVTHVTVFTDPSVDVAGYISPYRFVYLAAGDAWKKRPYLPMSHMDTLGRILSRQHSPASGVEWFFLVSDRTFVNVPRLLELVRGLPTDKKGYYGQVANATRKESFGFHEYVDLNTGVLLSGGLLTKVVDPANCHDQKSAGGTFDMFDAKLGNCVFFLGAQPQRLDGFENEPPERCDARAAGGGLGGAVTYGKVDPELMATLSECGGMINRTAAEALRASVRSERYPVRDADISLHVMARETKLTEIVADVEGTWGANVTKVYYHVDKQVAQASYTISRGRWGISPNLAGGVDGKEPLPGARPPASQPKGRVARIAALNLPERPNSQGEHWTISHDKGMNWNTWLRFKMKAIFEFSIRAHWDELQTPWYVYVDDDTYVLLEPLKELLARYDPRAAYYFGRPLQEEGHPVFVGGGAGIVLSRAAALQILSLRDAPECDPLALKWVDRIHQGGDAWLGECADAAGVHVDMEYGFYPQPPVANMFQHFRDAVSFHGVEDMTSMHRALSANASGGLAYDPRCVPVFVNHKYTCLPHFIIGGVPKAGTTSLYKYLMEHPEVLPASDKELTFWGNFFSPKRRPGREEVMSKYLNNFPVIEPGDFKVTGEATPGYLYCSTCPTYILKYIPKVRFLFTLRNPLGRSYSEYLNKVVDHTVMRYLKKRIDNKMDKDLSTKQPPFTKLVDDVAATMQTCGSPARTYSMMDEYTDEQLTDGCYINPFVGEGLYARYLREWLRVVPKRQIMILNFDEWTQDAQTTMQAVADFLNLAPHRFATEKAHNTHMARSVHVGQDGASNVSQLRDDSVEAKLPFGTHCVLHEFFAPYAGELDSLFAEYGYPPMRWDTSTRDGLACPTSYTYWRTLKGSEMGAANRTAAPAPAG